MLKFIDSLSFVFNCFCTKPIPTNERKENDKLTRNIYDMSQKHNINILPINMNYEINNLYPKSNMVHEWTILIIGNDKTYILANINAPGLGDSEKLLNHKGTGLFPEPIEEFLEPVWDKTLKGNNLQFFMLYNGKTYLVNTYAMSNHKGKVIGACLFMRLFESLPSTSQYQEGITIDNVINRTSTEMVVI